MPQEHSGALTFTTVATGLIMADVCLKIVLMKEIGIAAMLGEHLRRSFFASAVPSFLYIRTLVRVKLCSLLVYAGPYPHVTKAGETSVSGTRR